MGRADTSWPSSLLKHKASLTQKSNVIDSINKLKEAVRQASVSFFAHSPSVWWKSTASLLPEARALALSVQSQMTMKMQTSASPDQIHSPETAVGLFQELAKNPALEGPSRWQEGSVECELAVCWPSSSRQLATVTHSSRKDQDRSSSERLNN